MINNTPIANLLDQAKISASKGLPTTCLLKATVITPNKQIEVPRVEGMVILSAYGEYHSDSIQLGVSISPGIYQTEILGNKDDLYIELVEIMGIYQTSYRFRAVPLGDTTPQVAGTSTHTVDMAALDNLNLVTVTFQLIDIGYDKIKNVMVAGNYLAATPDQVIHNVYTREINQLGLTGISAFKGVDIEKPIDNIKVFRSITLPSGTKLTDVANYLQQADGYGVYSRGLGSYYRQGVWMVYPLFKIGRYDTLAWNIDVIRVPQDVMPTIEASYYLTGDKKLTVLTAGEGKHINGTDINHQNKGTGQRIISADVIAGDTGVHVNNGRAIKTRQDSVTEYRTTLRKSGEDIVPINAVPTNNMYREMSKTAFAGGDTVQVEWHNSDWTLLHPGAPIRYYYMIKDVLKLREGTLLAARTEYLPANQQFNISFKKHTVVTLHLSPEQSTEEYSNPENGNSYSQ